MPLFIGLLYAVTLVVLTGILITLDAFDWFYEASRKHEEWELDEIILGVFAALMVSSVGFGINSFFMLRRVRRETALRSEYQREVAQSRHLKSLGLLASGLAHSANNYLQPIGTLGRLARDDTDKKSPNYELLDRIVQSAESASDLFREVLAYSSPHPDTNSRLQLTETLVRIEPLLRVSLSNVETLVIQSEAAGAIPIDPTSFTDIMLALVTNSDAACNPDHGEIHISTIEDADTLSVIVDDNGSGMRADVLEQAFNPFFTTKKINEGTGLGLSIVTSLVEKAGGAIELKSELNKGTRVVLRFPHIDNTR